MAELAKIQPKLRKYLRKLADETYTPGSCIIKLFMAVINYIT